MTIEQPLGETSHKAGWIGFRPGEADHLYIATGDGAWRRTVADPYQVSQDLRSNLGKMLRIDINRDDFASDPGRNYAIPQDNPWADGVAANAEIWSYGLRNPFRASFDRLTGDLWLADVGFTRWDEVDFLANGSPGGTNWGWNLREGSSGPEVPGATDPVFTTPVGSGAAIIGGVVYRGPDASLAGRYVFADHVTGRIRSLRYDGSQVSDVQDLTDDWLAGLGPAAISSFGEDAAGRLYVTDLANGRLLALSTPVPEPAPAALTLAGLAGLLARRRRTGPGPQPPRAAFRPAPGR
jgi:glucose/arabinose dehydrogenase